MRIRINNSTRFQAVCEIFSGAKVADVARRYGVNRTTVYRWVKRCRQAALESLKSAGRTRQQEERIRRKLERKVVALQRRLEKKSNLIKSLRKEVRKKAAPDPRPPLCPKCGCEKIYKNGLYYQPLSKIITPEVYFAQKIPVKRFVCASCHNSITLDLPEVLHHWFKLAAKNSRPPVSAGKEARRGKEIFFPPRSGAN